MSEVIYISRVHIERKQGPLRVATLPGESEQVTFGVHGAIAVHYGRDPNELQPHASTLDYIVAAAGG